MGSLIEPESCSSLFRISWLGQQAPRIFPCQGPVLGLQAWVPCLEGGRGGLDLMRWDYPFKNQSWSLSISTDGLQTCSFRCCYGLQNRDTLLFISQHAEAFCLHLVSYYLKIILPCTSSTREFNTWATLQGVQCFCLTASRRDLQNQKCHTAYLSLSDKDIALYCIITVHSTSNHL